MKKFKRKVTGEGKVFDRVWDSRGHYSRVSGQPISQFEYDNRMCFAHVLSKNHFPLFRLYQRNIELLTKDQHDFWDSRNESSLRGEIDRGESWMVEMERRTEELGEDWSYMMELEEELRKEYIEAAKEWHKHGEFLPGSKFYDLNPILKSK